MALTAKIQMRQSQSVVMTPQLMQSIKLLQFSHLELEHYIDQEMERNPLLESVDGNQPLTDTTSDPLENQERETHEAALITNDLPFDAKTIANALDTSLDNVFPDDPGTAQSLSPDLTMQWRSHNGSTPAQGGASDEFDLDQINAGITSLNEHIRDQIGLTFHTQDQRLIALDLAGQLDENGYLCEPIEETAQRLACTIDDVLHVLKRCQQLEPVGVFARDLRECLAIQLQEIDRFDPAMAAMIANLDLLANRDFAKLREICQVDDHDLFDMLNEIKALNPKPGSCFDNSSNVAIVPDVIVKSAPDGSWNIELNPQALPRVLINQAYVSRVDAACTNKDDRTFVQECLQSATWLMRSLDQRAKTILKVASEIVRQQDGFFIHGISHLRPLTLRMVADAIEMHESTVSRVTTNKFMVTPRGVFEMRYFFTTAINSTDQTQNHSSETVRHKIRQLIENEGTHKILSDDAIVNCLKAEGIDLARRTVAKYREAMNIASSVQRRREKKTRDKMQRDTLEKQELNPH